MNINCILQDFQMILFLAHFRIFHSIQSQKTHQVKNFVRFSVRISRFLSHIEKSVFLLDQTQITTLKNRFLDHIKDKKLTFGHLTIYIYR